MAWKPLPTGSATQLQPLGIALDKLARSLGVPSADAMTQIFNEWPDLVGGDVATNTQPRSLDNGVLTIAVLDPAWTTQIKLLEADLLHKITAVIGPDVVLKLRARVEA